MIFLNEELRSSSDFINVLGGPQHKKLFERLRYSLKLVPDPIKVSEGNGVKSYFPDFTFKFFIRIVDERKNGSSYDTIKEKFKPEIEDIFLKNNAFVRQYAVEKKIRAQLVAKNSRPDFVIEDKYGKRTMLIEVKSQQATKAQIRQAKEQLKSYFKEWNGNSIPMLNKIRNKIEEVETLEARERVARAISQSV